MKPTETDTVAVIKAWLDEKGVSYAASATKADLLALVEQAGDVAVDSATVENTEPSTKIETKYTKRELLSFTIWTGGMRDVLTIVLKNDVKYTYNEAVQTANNWKNGGLF